MSAAHVIDNWDEGAGRLERLKARGREVMEGALRMEREAEAARARAQARLSAAKDCEKKAMQALEHSWRLERGPGAAEANHLRKTYERLWKLAEMNAAAAASEHELAAALDGKHLAAKAEAMRFAEEIYRLSSGPAR